MSLQTNIKGRLDQSGFTIVELLIVIVIIAILAAITIVGYNGITARANSSSALASAQGVAKKVEAYNAEISNYPATQSALTADSSASYYVASTNFAAVGATIPYAAKPASAGLVYLTACVVSSVNVGIKVWYWKYEGTGAGLNSINVGNTTTGCADSTRI